MTRDITKHLQYHHHNNNNNRHEIEMGTTKRSTLLGFSRGTTWCVREGNKGGNIRGITSETKQNLQQHRNNNNINRHEIEMGATKRSTLLGFSRGTTWYVREGNKGGKYQGNNNNKNLSLALHVTYFFYSKMVSGSRKIF